MSAFFPNSKKKTQLWYGVAYLAKQVQKFKYFGRRTIGERLRLRPILTISFRLLSGHFDSARADTVDLICMQDRSGLWKMVHLHIVLEQPGHGKMNAICPSLCGHHPLLTLTQLRTSGIF